MVNGESGMAWGMKREGRESEIGKANLRKRSPEGIRCKYARQSSAVKVVL
jgi:hypothetical protein